MWEIAGGREAPTPATGSRINSQVAGSAKVIYGREEQVRKDCPESSGLDLRFLN